MSDCDYDPVKELRATRRKSKRKFMDYFCSSEFCDREEKDENGDNDHKEWCDILEELMECPVCLDVPKDSIYQCVKGHDVCKLCRKLLDKCPVCKEALSETRNWTLEKIVAKFGDIKLSLMEPENAINNVVNPTKKSIKTQTTETGGPPILRRSTRTTVLAKAEKRAANGKK